MDKLKFPRGFLWGAATSAHQVEGGNRNDWTAWEKQNAEKLAKSIAKKSPEFLRTLPALKEQAGDPQNYISGTACDHYNRFLEDFELARSLHQNVHRFSVEWSRIEPQEGVFDEEAIRHYQEVVKALKTKGLEPFVTLWHFTLPGWLSEKGGWNGQRSVMYFNRYVEKVVTALSPQVRFWITINEPQVYAALSYLKGVWPPQKKDPRAYWRVIQNLIHGHKLAYTSIKQINPSAQVGIAKHNIYFEADKNKPINQLLKRIADWWLNYYVLDEIKNHQDFIGLNYYFHNRISWWFGRNENKQVSDLGWELYPAGIYHVLAGLKKYNRPIYVTENGLADATDTRRGWYIEEVLRNIHKALVEKVDVRGYMHWSLLDNFEWAYGFWPRFGLVEVDFKTQKRTVRDSAYKYAEICKSNAVSAAAERQS